MTRHLGRLLFVGLLGGVLALGWMGYRIWDTGNRDDRRQADAIVVLGAAQYDGRPSAILKARLDHGIQLFNDGAAPWFVVASAIFVSDRTHMLRVLRIATDEGIASRGSPTTTSPTDATLPNQVEATIREVGALALYFVGAEIADRAHVRGPNRETIGSSSWL
ncbi:MAG: hypothetical protein H0U52_13630 [Chloroflexi bacterium]|nr:hypothetical protein [Chloroflexota bacterium]